jgi:hypothetical protein
VAEEKFLQNHPFDEYYDSDDYPNLADAKSSDEDEEDNSEREDEDEGESGVIPNGEDNSDCSDDEH